MKTVKLYILCIEPNQSLKNYITIKLISYNIMENGLSIYESIK